MKGPTDTPQLFPVDDPRPAPVSKQVRLTQKFERLESEAACHLSKLEKSRSRARFIVGEIVLDDPALWALVRTGVEAGLPKVGSARKAVDDYGKTVGDIEALRAYLGRGGSPGPRPPQSGEAPRGVPASS